MNAGKTFLAFIAGFVFLAFSAAAYGQGSPVGDWNLRVSGIVKGDVYLTFLSDGTIDGYIGLGRNPKAKVPGNIDTVVFGTFNLTGEWGFNAKGNRVVGYFSGIVDDLEFNVQSFTAKVQGGKMIMKAKSNDGELTFKGEPAVALTDITGTWTAKVRERVKGEKQEEVFTEVLELTPSASTNVYDVLGEGANFTVCGFLILSNPNRVVLVSEKIPTEDFTGACEDGVVRGLTGKLNFNKSTANLSGSDDDDLEIQMNVEVQ